MRGLKLASNIEVSYNLYARYQTEFMIYGSPSRNHGTDELRQGLLAEIKLLQTQAIKTEELKRVIIQIIAQKTFEKDSIFSQAMELGMLESTGLGWVLSEKYLDEISKITPKDIQETAKLFFQENNQTEATLIPEKIKLKNSTHGDL